MSHEDGDSGKVCPLDSGGRPSYWLDACEDVSCDDYFVDFEASATAAPTAEHEPKSQDGCHDSCFFGGIDQIFDTLKNGGDELPARTTSHCNSNVANDSRSSARKEDQYSVSRSGIMSSNGMRTPSSSARIKDEETVGGKRAREIGDFGQRYDKRPRGSDPMKDRRIWDRAPGMKRNRGWDNIEMDGQSRDQLRRRKPCNTGGRKDRDYKESSGYWERDKVTNELVFRSGSWESCRNRDEKVHPQNGNKSDGGSEEKNDNELKQKPPEEQARQYQFDVFEQAKKRNSIAFLETGAGKTPIAVLLMKSVSIELQKQNKKMLAVFLVPKVSLVYQQAEVIRERIGYQVGHYCGEMGQDFWDARRWQREFESERRKQLEWALPLNLHFQIKK